MLRQDSTGSNRQHYSSVVHKQGWRHEVGQTLCPTVENPDLVYQKSSDRQSSSRQAIQVRLDHPNRMVSPSRGLPNNISAQSADTTIQSDPSQKSDKSKSPCMAPRASAIKEQGFSEAVAARIEAPQRGSTRSVYEAKWAIFTKWCIINKVDFRAPPVNSITDFLMYLFQDRKLQPNTIDGYRSAIPDKPGNSS